MDWKLIRLSVYVIYNPNEINSIHKEIHSDLRCRIGVSTRYLQGYLDMFYFK